MTEVLLLCSSETKSEDLKRGGGYCSHWGVVTGGGSKIPSCMKEWN